MENKNIINTNSMNVSTLPNGTITTTTTSFYRSQEWSEPELMEVNETEESIELIYREKSMNMLMTYPPKYQDDRIFKIIFSCKDGKWNKSERIYGKIIPAVEETYEFE